MLRQDLDPLADTVPPRHAYESDEEDEFAPFPSHSSGQADTPQDVHVAIDVAPTQPAAPGRALIVASGAAGTAWARGAELGEQAGRVAVEGKQVGLVFRPAWTDAVVLVSEGTARLPVWAMHPYAEAVLDYWKPSRVSILDTYTTSTYITSHPVAHYDAPIRYLHIGPRSTAHSAPVLAPFAPPNLLQTTAASFLAILALPHWSSDGKGDTTLLLLPADRGEEGWDGALVGAAHRALLTAAGVAETAWRGAAGGDRRDTGKGRARAGDVGEGSMYI